MKSVWTIPEAQKKLSEVIDCAAEDGPQAITRNRKRIAVILSAEHFQRLSYLYDLASSLRATCRDPKTLEGNWICEVFAQQLCPFRK